MNSIYHILDKPPAIYKEEMQDEYENLALELFESGKLRIDTGYYCNFVRYSDPSLGISMFFSYEELHNPTLVEKTKNRIKQIYKNNKKIILDKKISAIMIDLDIKAGKLLMIDAELKMMLSRIFVQSAHPIAIMWLLLDEVEIFITYSNSIGEMMDISTWKRAGNNSGMQSTDGKNACIYVSCGGDPFAPNSQTNPIYGDGWAALARLQIIAGQEIGHFADIKRDQTGKQISRHSANFSCTKAAGHVKKARTNDIERCESLLVILKKCGIDRLIAVETELRFYHKQKISSLRTWPLKILAKIYRKILLKNAQKRKLIFVQRFDREKFIGLSLFAMLKDMQSHLSPIAEVYKRDHPESEEAISCVEALARVPQQVNKWGYLTTKATMHDLYKIYYNKVIPSLIENYEHVTGEKYKRSYNIPKKNFLNRIFTKLKIVKNKGDFKFTEVRDI